MDNGEYLKSRGWAYADGSSGEFTVGWWDTVDSTAVCDLGDALIIQRARDAAEERRHLVALAAGCIGMPGAGGHPMAPCDAAVWARETLAALFPAAEITDAAKVARIRAAIDSGGFTVNQLRDILDGKGEG